MLISECNADSIRTVHGQFKDLICRNVLLLILWESLARRGKCAREGILCVWVCELDEMTFLVKIILVTLYTVQTRASHFFRFTCISFVGKMIGWQVSYDRFGYQCLRCLETTCTLITQCVHALKAISALQHLYCIIVIETRVHPMHLTSKALIAGWLRSSTAGFALMHWHVAVSFSFCSAPDYKTLAALSH